MDTLFFHIQTITKAHAINILGISRFMKKNRPANELGIERTLQTQEGTTPTLLASPQLQNASPALIRVLPSPTNGMLNNSLSIPDGTNPPYLART